MAASSIKITSGETTGAEFEIDRELVLGRENCDVTLPDPEASRRHAAVRPADGGVEVEDLGSLNGTFVNDERLEGTRVISESATVRVGLTTLRVELAEAVEPATPDEPVAAPDVTAPRAIAQPDVTAPRAIPEPDVTARRAIPEPDVTAPRATPDPDVTPPRAIPEPDVTAPRAIPKPDVTAPRAIPQPDVTAPREIPQPDVTAPRRIATPDVTAPRAVQKAEGPPPSAPAHKGPQRVRELAPILVGGLLGAVVVALIIALLFG